MRRTGPGAPNATIQTDNVTDKLSLQYWAPETLHFVPRTSGTVADITYLCNQPLKGYPRTDVNRIPAETEYQSQHIP